MYISSGVSNTCLFAPAPYYKLNKGLFLGFLFKPLGGLRPPRGLNEKASEKNPLSITKQIDLHLYMEKYTHIKSVHVKDDLRLSFSNYKKNEKDNSC